MLSVCGCIGACFNWFYVGIYIPICSVQCVIKLRAYCAHVHIHVMYVWRSLHQKMLVSKIYSLPFKWFLLFCGCSTSRRGWSQSTRLTRTHSFRGHSRSDSAVRKWGSEWIYIPYTYMYVAPCFSHCCSLPDLVGRSMNYETLLSLNFVTNLLSLSFHPVQTGEGIFVS